MSRIAIIGISAYFHDSAVALIIDGEIIAAAQEERFSRIKNDASFPINALRYILERAYMHTDKISAVVFYEKPFLKFERIVEMYHIFAPYGFKSFLEAIPIWIKEKLFLKRKIQVEIKGLGLGNVPLLFSEHHLSHAGSAFYPSPYEKAAILIVDGVGEWATMSIGFGYGKNIKILKELRFPHSLGLFYSAFTHYLGFRVNNGEYKVMGLAPYGDIGSEECQRVYNTLLSEVIDIREDGSILLNMKYFNYVNGLTMTNNDEIYNLIQIPYRKSDDIITQGHKNLAMAIQKITEEVMIALAKTAKEITQCNYLVLAGGVALNCVANTKILESNLYGGIWVQPAAGDAGGAIGAALNIYHQYFHRPRTENYAHKISSYYLGPKYSLSQIETVLLKNRVNYKQFRDSFQLYNEVACMLEKGAVVGWFQGRMEFGPRALGNRSILADPRLIEMQKHLNQKVKFREDFRPFAPCVLKEDFEEYFMGKGIYDYMLFVAYCKEHQPLKGDKNKEVLKKDLNVFPAVVHLDYSSRVQSVDRTHNEKLWKLLKAFKKKTGVGMLVNTSFNVMDEPIVCSPEDAYRNFIKSGIDVLVMENFLIKKYNKCSL
ncbi:carbamoyltransferase family protein [Galbibacter pacificus]|uniref:Carbamoyltransferase n=1 Tax=Galbibacter pacificus TaxID=2996052 RepID=A0ABT6FMY9_9FLAO|nr:carbamoyltransferase N-terminal domain-containing protein [Galbibacter pacificus]MDG3581064.1 carbamoyltransferase N-terminal domain-containing protein [Galbibacter pacificus]MDG3584542.1 hypothetical protein [Galbibacter pacificus]